MQRGVPRPLACVLLAAVMGAFALHAGACSYDYTIGDGVPEGGASSSGNPSTDAGTPSNGPCNGRSCTCESHDDCRIGCDVGRCAPECENESNCNVSCNGGGCNTTCAEGAECDVSCPGGSCTITCAPGSRCRLDCPGGACRMLCSRGARCDIDCPDGVRCSCDGDGCR